MTDIALSGLTPLSSVPAGASVLLAKLDPTNSAKKLFGAVDPATFATAASVTAEAAARASADTAETAARIAADAAEVTARNTAISAAVAGGLSGSVIDVTYTTSGAIDPAKLFVALNASTVLVMTLTNGTAARVPMFIKNLGTANATVALKLDGSSLTITLLPTDVVELAWSVALTTWVEIGATGPGVQVGGLPTLSVGVGGNLVPVVDIDGTTTKKLALSAARVGVNQGEVALTSGSSVATNALLGNVFTLTLAVNATLANPTGMIAGATYMWRIKQDATGSRTLAYGTAFKWPGGTAPTLSTAANAVDIISASTDGTNVYAVASKGFA